LDDDLRAEHQLSLPEYGALLLLAEADGRRLRMRALADALQLSKSGVTRLIDRLVAGDLVERRQCPTDARGAEALLTPTGLERLREAAPSHLRGIQAYFLSAVPGPELAALERTMLGIADRLSGADSGREARVEPAAPPPRARPAARAARAASRTE
jgi:DNA-binding MarR family transcriptional regulator